MELLGRANSIEFVSVGEYVELRVEVRISATISRLVFGYMIKDRLEQPIFGTNTEHTEQASNNVKPGDAFAFSVWFSMNLGPGYSVATALTGSETHLVNNYEWKD